MSSIGRAFASGYENLSAWADLLDRINVFPVADGDTGANLRISLAPLRDCEADRTQTSDLLARSATGNSGNIAAAFFQEFHRSDGFTDLAENAARGREKAWQSLARPQAGTMLSVFDSLAATLAAETEPLTLYPLLCKELQGAVLATAQILPDLRQAGVVDSGALGMYVFFEGFFRHLTGQTGKPDGILELFPGRLTINTNFEARPSALFCVNAVIQTGDDQPGAADRLAEWGESVVVLPAESSLKVHIHTADRQRLRTQLSALGEIVAWSDESMDNIGRVDVSGLKQRPVVHIMSDAAGSMTRALARRHDITLLDSYIVANNRSRPESLSSPAEIYTLMREGNKVGTAQSSIFERQQHYQSVCQQFGRTLYLCVGSTFTGNHELARRWQEENDPGNLLEVLDTGAASGRLGLIALLAARYAGQASSPEEVISFVEKTMATCHEYSFIDHLRYLVAGGRVSRAGGFFADLLHLKPVISQSSDGVHKVAMLHDRTGQLTFALQKLQEVFIPSATPIILLQYTDNEQWVTESAEPKVRALLPEAEILLAPLSLTSGVHLGPGSWSLAWAGGQVK